MNEFYKAILSELRIQVSLNVLGKDLDYTYKVINKIDNRYDLQWLPNPAIENSRLGRIANATTAAAFNPINKPFAIAILNGDVLDLCAYYVIAGSIVVSKLRQVDGEILAEGPQISIGDIVAKKGKVPIYLI